MQDLIVDLGKEQQKFEISDSQLLVHGDIGEQQMRFPIEQIEFEAELKRR